MTGGRAVTGCKAPIETPRRLPWIAAVAAGAVLVAGLAATAAPEDGPVHFADQSWSETDRAWFYGASQGSQIMPYAWFLSLEAPEGGDLFVTDRLGAVRLPAQSL